MFKNCVFITGVFGVSLLEVMFAMSAGIILFGLLLSVYQITQQNLLRQQALYQIQDHANFALTLLKHDIAQAGQIGCARKFIFNQRPLMGTAHDITLSYARIGPILNASMKNNIELRASREPRIENGMDIVITDCVRIAAAKVAHVYVEKNQQRIILQSPLSVRFAKYAEIGLLVNHHYFVKKTAKKNTDGTSRLSLFDQQNARLTELMSGINALQFTYTIKTNKQVKNVEAEKIVDWTKVIGVLIHITLFTAPYYHEAYAYSVLNASRL